MLDLCKQNEYLKNYLEYVEDTESPKIFHIWAALSATAACLGRRVWFELGFLTYYSNLYIVLTGSPGVRKSEALKIVKRLLKASTGVRFAPDDTGGQRQGLIKAMTAGKFSVDEEETMKAKALFAELLDDKSAVADIGGLQLDARDPYSMYICQEEFNSFIGERNTQLMNFLIKAYDGDDYTYRLKTEEMILNEPLLNILAATTPSQIALALPPEALGQGVTTRMIFVYGDKKYKSIPWPEPLNDDLGGWLRSFYSHVFNNMEGLMGYTQEAKETLISLYEVKANVEDPRFSGYAQRRFTQIIKLSVILAIGERRMILEGKDVLLSHQILRATEATMPDAFGEYGLNKLAAAKQKFIEYLRAADEVVPQTTVFTHLSRDMSRMECGHVIQDLINSGQIAQIKMKDGSLGFISKEFKVREAKHERMLLAKIAEGKGNE